MIDELQQQRAALYAIDLLEGAELAKFEVELSEDGKLQRLVHELREASASFALTAPQAEPSPELKARVMTAIGEPPEVSSASIPALLRPAVIIPWTIAAAFAVSCAWLGQLYMQSRAGYSVVQDESALSQLEITTVKNQLEAERIISNQRMTDATKELTELNEQLVRSTEKIIEATRVLSTTYDQLDRARAEILERQAQVADLAEKLGAALDELAELRKQQEKEN